MIFERFGCARAFAAYIARTQQNTVKTDTNSTSELSRDKTKTTKKGSDDASDFACRVAHTPTSLRTGPGASWDLPWKPPLFDLRTLDFIDAWLKKVV